MWAGRDFGQSTIQNSGVFSTEYDVIPDPALVTYPVFRSVMMAMVQVWGAVSADAFSSDLIDACELNDKHNVLRKRLFRPSWMTYLDAPRAALITPPAGVLCERTPDGGLLLIAAEETFDVANPRHMAAAWAISDALASLTKFS